MSDPHAEAELPTEVMIEAGCQASHELEMAMIEREASDHPEDMPDYDEGDVCRAVWRAMEAARPTIVSDEVVFRVLKKQGFDEHTAHVVARAILKALETSRD